MHPGSSILHTGEVVPEHGEFQYCGTLAINDKEVWPGGSPNDGGGDGCRRGFTCPVVGPIHIDVGC